MAAHLRFLSFVMWGPPDTSGIPCCAWATDSDAGSQRHAVHKLRDLACRTPEHALPPVSADFHRIVYAENRMATRSVFTAFERKCRTRCPGHHGPSNAESMRGPFLMTSMDRRDVIRALAALGGAAIVRPVTALAQQPKRLRVGTANILPKERSGTLPGFEERMAQLGYEQGRNFDLEFVKVPSAGEYGQAYREIAARKVDVILALDPEIALKSALAVAGSCRLSRDHDLAVNPAACRRGD